jgi:hypothetical protein
MFASKQVFTGRLPAEAIGVSSGGANRPGLNAEIRATVRIAPPVGIKFGDRS